ncbi:carboxylesterase [Ilyonectria destructans]|nr:carboxylesterase [Ilyonectria destructans]
MLGVVNLGYAIHMPTFINSTRSGRCISIYNNIRFANAPINNLRFRKPHTNIPNTDCIASAPAGAPFPTVNGTTWGHEDCLFLDVYEPEDVRPGDNVPVLHFFFGSAYAFGNKDLWFNPLGLFDLGGHNSNFIFVANNYRTSKYVGRFGGDRNRITVMGQSAGAGVIQLLTVLNGGQGTLPFYRYSPRRNVSARQTPMFRTILESANCTTLALCDSKSNPAKLAWDWTTDVIFGCNAYSITRALPFRTYRYIVSAPPATHAYDLSYYFHVDQETTPVTNLTIAYAFQRRLLRFIYGEEIPWPKYARRERLANITDGGFEMVNLRDDLKKRATPS